MSILPETSSARDDIECVDCTAACCRAGMEMIMTRKEVSANGLKMPREIIAPISDSVQVVQIRNKIDGSIFRGTLLPGREYSKLAEDCGHLTPDNKCGIFGKPHRPASCLAFEPGSEACLYAREQAGFND